MNKIVKKSILLVTSAMLVTASVMGNEKLIISGNPEYPPITWRENNTIVGVSAELAKMIFTELGVPFEIKYTGPWSRVQANAMIGKIDMISSAYINPERKTYLDFTIPFMVDPVSVFVKKGKPFPFNKWTDLIKKKGNTVRGESYGDEFDEFIEDKLDVDRVSTTILNFRKLEAERIDYAIIGLYPGLASASINGFENKIEVLPHYILTANFYMAFSKKSKFKYLLPKVNEILQRLKNEGAIEKLVKKYQKYYKDSKIGVKHKVSTEDDD